MYELISSNYYIFIGQNTDIGLNNDCEDSECEKLGAITNCMGAPRSSKPPAIEWLFIIWYIWKKILPKYWMDLLFWARTVAIRGQSCWFWPIFGDFGGNWEFSQISSIHAFIAMFQVVLESLLAIFGHFPCFSIFLRKNIKNTFSQEGSTVYTHNGDLIYNCDR